MTASDASSSSENSYTIDIEEAAETGRLMEQDRLLTQAMGGLIEGRLDLTGVRRVLDIGCGPGGWALELAAQNPQMEIVGVDINETMIRYAFAQAQVRRLENVTFEVMDARRPLAFRDAAFDLVNARWIFAFMDRQTWPALIAECRRILRPGGLLRFSEPETTVTNSAAFQAMMGHLYAVLARLGRTFSVDGRTTGVPYMLGKLLKEAGFQDIQHQPYIVDGSYGADMYYTSMKDTEVAFALSKPFLTRIGGIPEAEYDELYQRLLLDMLDENHVGICYALTVWGRKPEPAGTSAEGEAAP